MVLSASFKIKMTDFREEDCHLLFKKNIYYKPLLRDFL